MSIYTFCQQKTLNEIGKINLKGHSGKCVVGLKGDKITKASRDFAIETHWGL